MRAEKFVARAGRYVLQQQLLLAELQALNAAAPPMDMAIEFDAANLEEMVDLRRRQLLATEQFIDLQYRLHRRIVDLQREMLRHLSKAPAGIFSGLESNHRG